MLIDASLAKNEKKADWSDLRYKTKRKKAIPFLRTLWNLPVARNFAFHLTLICFSSNTLTSTCLGKPFTCGLGSCVVADVSPTATQVDRDLEFGSSLDVNSSRSQSWLRCISDWLLWSSFMSRITAAAADPPWPELLKLLTRTLPVALRAPADLLRTLK